MRCSRTTRSSCAPSSLLGYTEARVLPGVYFFAASALMTMLAYGWANASPPVRRRRAKGGGPAISIATPNKRKVA